MNLYIYYVKSQENQGVQFMILYHFSNSEYSDYFVQKN